MLVDKRDILSVDFSDSPVINITGQWLIRFINGDDVYTIEKDELVKLFEEQQK